MTVILWAVFGIAAIGLLIVISAACSSFAQSREAERVFDEIMRVLFHVFVIAVMATLFAGVLIVMLERGGA